MITKQDIFPILTAKDAQKAQRLMEAIAGSEDETEQEVFQIMRALAREWSARQPCLARQDPLETIRHALELRDLSQRDLALAIGTSESSLSAILNGTRLLSEKTARKIAEALEVPLETLRPQRKTG